MQNEIIGVIGEYIRKEATKPLQLPLAMYTLIANEATDNKEIMSDFWIQAKLGNIFSIRKKQLVKRMRSNFATH